MDQSTSTHGRRQKTPTVIFNSECPKVVDRFRKDSQGRVQYCMCGGEYKTDMACFAGDNKGK